MCAPRRSTSLVPRALVVAFVVTAAMMAATVGAVSTNDFTRAQRLHTQRMLEALSLGAPGDTPSEGSEADFCAWPGVACHRLSSGGVGAEVTITSDRRVQLPAPVNESEVRITSLKVRVSALAKDGEFLSSLASVRSSTLTTLDFTGSHITSELPPMWGTFVSLQYLRLGDNNFYGTLPTAWSALVALVEFQLQNNQVTGTIPSSWSSMTQMGTMVLDNNGLNGTLPSSWSSMTSLTNFSLAGNKVCGGVPPSWSVMSGLHVNADPIFYRSCTDTGSASSLSASSASSEESSASGGRPSTSTSVGPTTTPTSPGTTTTTESPAILTSCATGHCVLCPISAPSRCSVCWPGYTLTVGKTCEMSGQNAACGLGLHWQHLVVVSVVLLVAAMSGY